MSAPLFSSSWYRVAELRPRLRRHARINRHLYRGEAWYVLEDVASQRVHRFSPATHAVLRLMDGERSVQEIWELATETLGDEAPTQDEVIQLLGQLHGADVLQCDVPPDTAELLRRHEQYERRQWQSRLMSPLAIRIPLLDPDRFLRRMAPHLRPLMGPLGAALWLALVLPAGVLAVLHADALTENWVDRVLSVQNLVLIWLVFPLIKALHELGHGLLARYFGAEVHDMGVMLLIFTPVPYVDASSASAFPDKRARALVAAGGMVVELLVGALAFYVWLLVEPGVVRSVAYNAMLVASVTTLTFNANPLLRFDGYYILSDWLEIPNLRQRASEYVAWLVQHHALGARDAEPPEADPGERLWLLGFAVASFVYRVIVVAFILLFVFELSFLLGVVLAATSLVTWVVRPVWRAGRFLATSPTLRAVRPRAFAVAGGAALAAALVVLALPLPWRTQAEGVVWIPDEALVRAGTGGFVERVHATPGARVRVGDPLVDCRDPELQAQAQVLAARLRGLEVQRREARLRDLPRAQMLADEIEALGRRLQRVQERLDALVIRSGATGTFVADGIQDWPGRFVEQGELLAHVVEVDTLRVRAVVPQEDIELVRERLRRVELRRAERLDQVLEGRVTRLVPAASPALPSPALGSAGGGAVAVDPRDESGTSAVAPFFQVEIELPAPEQGPAVGGRVHVRFDHGWEPLASRWARALRQLLLSRLDV
jgi:putative peptide zinc metalloprotease protein